MNIPFCDLGRSAEELIDKDGLMEKLESTLRSGRFLFGKNSEELEKWLSNYYKAHVVLVGSGTDAIVLALKAIGVGCGDKIIIPALSAIPTAVAITMLGAIPVYVDVTKNTGGLDITKVKEKMSNDIKAIVPVHLYGEPVRLHKLSELGVPIVEDCAQSFGSVYCGNQVGTYGVAGALSFYPSKNAGIFGDGGGVITKDPNIAKTIRNLRFYGQKNKDTMGPIPGMNSRMDEIQAAILLKKIKRLPGHLQKRQELCYKYVNFIKNNCSNYIKILSWSDGAVPHLFPIRVHDRKLFMQRMSAVGVETAIHYPFTLPTTMGKDSLEYPNATAWSQEVVSLPFNPWLTDKEIDYILKQTKECL